MTIVFLIVIAALGWLWFKISRQPAEFRMTRSTVIDAPAAAIFPHVNGLRNWKAWSPWAKMEPNAAETYEGPPEGIGSKMSWVGKKTGTGSMTILESQANDLIRLRLEFLKSMKATNTTDFVFTPQDGGTLVTWSMYGPNTLMGKLMSVMTNCQKMVGGQFEKGLASLKAVAEGKGQ